MKKTICIISFFIFFNCYSQSFSTISKIGLPVISITTDNGELPTCDIVEAPENCMGVGITNAAKVPGRIVITIANDTIYDSGSYIKDTSGMTIKIRGNTSSAYSAKKSYKLKLQKKADLFCRNDSSYKDKDWLLLRTAKTYHTSIGLMVNKSIGIGWTPTTQFVNVFINDEYKGVYILAESVKRSDRRLNVNNDNGCIFEFDPYYWNEDFYVPTRLTSYKSLGWTFKYPEAKDLTTNQIDYFTRLIETMESDILNGEYSKWIDINSFAKWLLAHDILGDSDGGGSNMFLIKEDTDSLIKMGTLWDFDAAFTTINAFSSIHTAPFFIYKYLFRSNDKSFQNEYYYIWEKIKEEGFFVNLLDALDEMANSDESIAIDASRMIEDGNTKKTREQIADVKEWLIQRENFLDSLITAKYYCDNTGIIELEHISYTTLTGLKIKCPRQGGLYIVKGKKILFQRK